MPPAVGRTFFALLRADGESAETLALMRRIDELFLKYPFYGARRMALHLRREGVRIGRRRAGRLMRLMGLQAIYRAPRTSDPHPEHRVWPYLLRGLTIERPNHVWCADITYIPVQRGFLYLVAVMDWASRFVLAWRLSNTLDASFCRQFWPNWPKTQQQQWREMCDAMLSGAREGISVLAPTD